MTKDSSSKRPYALSSRRTENLTRLILGGSTASASNSGTKISAWRNEFDGHFGNWPPLGIGFESPSRALPRILKLNETGSDQRTHFLPPAFDDTVRRNQNPPTGNGVYVRNACGSQQSDHSTT